MFVISSPSGAGKTTLSRELRGMDKNLDLSISHTTRTPRPGEENGKDYFFVSEDEFAAQVKQDTFLEHVEVFGNCYGTPRKAVEEMLVGGRDVLFDIDWQGTLQLQKKAPKDVVSIYILPPSMAELEKRLRSRAQDSEEVITLRMKKARSEVSHWQVYDYVVINDNITKCVEKLKAILRTERYRRERQVGLESYIEKLCEE